MSVVPSVNAASPIKRQRRTRAQMHRLKDQIYSILRAEQPMTIRQLFYRMVALQMIPKTQKQYDKTVCRLAADLRRDGTIPYEWITDNTRWMRKTTSYRSLDDFLKRQQELYRHDLWATQDAYVEIWLEKDALAGVLMRSTDLWNVPLMVTRGYPSLSYLHEAAELIKSQEKPVYLYYFGDCDPSGRHIPVKVEQDLRAMSGREISFEVVAVTDEQIETMNLPTRPTKKTDSRSKSFKGRSVEVDAIPPKTLIEICDDCITQHIDEQSLRAAARVEEHEKATLQQFSEMLEGGE